MESATSDPEGCVDWSDKGVLTEIRDQGPCCVCWAITLANLIEAVYKIQHPQTELKQLSPQQLLNCCEEEVPASARDHPRKCYPYNYKKALNWIKNNGICTEAECPYVARKLTCQKNMGWSKLKITDFHRINTNDEEGLIKRLGFHPVAAAIDIHPELVDLRDEIYKGPKNPNVPSESHAVLIIAFHVDKNTKEKYFKIRSSWGTKWGIDGVGKILANSCAQITLLKNFYYPVFSKKN